jgi:hypothetical protein
VTPHVVESSIGNGATARIYVGSEKRAKEIVDDGARAGVVRTFRAISPDEMPAEARSNLEMATAQIAG